MSPLKKIGHPNILQLLILGTQFRNPGLDPDMTYNPRSTQYSQKITQRLL